MPRSINYHLPDAYDEMLQQLQHRWDTTQTQTHLRAIEWAWRLEFGDVLPPQVAPPLEDTRYGPDHNRRGAAEPEGLRPRPVDPSPPGGG